MKYRFYVDEVGSSDLGASHDPNHRYLSLTGIILSLEYVDAVVFPALEAMKRAYFGSHPDEPVILHRKELVNKQPPFENLRHPERVTSTTAVRKERSKAGVESGYPKKGTPPLSQGRRRPEPPTSRSLDYL